MNIRPGQPFETGPVIKAGPALGIAALGHRLGRQMCGGALWWRPYLVN